MANTTNQRGPIIVTRNDVAYPVAPHTRRWLKVMWNDINNIQLTAMDTEFDGREYQEARAIAMEHYAERVKQFDLMAKGAIPFIHPEGMQYDRIVIKEPVTTPTIKVEFYGPSWCLREIKHFLKQCLDLPAHPHGHMTKECGLLVFSVDSCTRQEAEKAYQIGKSSGLFVDVYIPEVMSATSQVGKTGRTRKQELRTVKRGNVLLTPHAEQVISSNEPATRQASSDELAILANAKALLEQDNEPIQPIEANDLSELTEL